MKILSFGSIVLMFLAVATLLSCKTTAKLADNSTLTDEDIILKLQRGPCFGKCPIYNISLYNNGYMKYKADRFVEAPGLYERNLTAKQLEEINKLVEKADFMSREDRYESGMVDLPLITLTYSNGTDRKVVSGREERPTEIKAVQYAMEKYVDLEGWAMIVKFADDEEPVRNEDDPNIYSEIIIVPAGQNRLPLWFKKNTEYGFSLKKRISKDLNMWLITYDVNKYTPEAIMDVLQNDKAIEKAEFNKRVSNRGGQR